MICAAQVRLMTPSSVPDSYDHSIHMAVGIIVFLPVLIGCWLCLNKYYERNR